MKRLFLASSVITVAHLIGDEVREHDLGQRILYIPTAAEVEDGDHWWLDADKHALTNAGFLLEELSLTDKRREEVEAAMERNDGVFVAGGNTFYLLEKMLACGFDALIDMYLARGMYYIGSSAGSVVAGPDIDNAKILDDFTKGPNLQSFRGLGLVDFEIFPHWGSEIFDRSYIETMKYAYKMGHKIILLTDDQFVCVTGERYEIVGT